MPCIRISRGYLEQRTDMELNVAFTSMPSFVVPKGAARIKNLPAYIAIPWSFGRLSWFWLWIGRSNESPVWSSCRPLQIWWLLFILAIILFSRIFIVRRIDMLLARIVSMLSLWMTSFQPSLFQNGRIEYSLVWPSNRSSFQVTQKVCNRCFEYNLF